LLGTLQTLMAAIMFVSLGFCAYEDEKHGGVPRWALFYLLAFGAIGLVFFLLETGDWIAAGLSVGVSYAILWGINHVRRTRGPVWGRADDACYLAVSLALPGLLGGLIPFSLLFLVFGLIAGLIMRRGRPGPFIPSLAVGFLLAVVCFGLLGSGVPAY